MTNYQKAEMLLQFAGEMIIKNRLKIANWAMKQSYKYYNLQMSGSEKVAN